MLAGKNIHSVVVKLLVFVKQFHRSFFFFL